MTTTVHHHAIVAVGDVEKVRSWIDSAGTAFARDLFVIQDGTGVNLARSVVMFPDGSWPGRNHSARCDRLRDRFVVELNRVGLVWVEVSFGDDNPRIGRSSDD